MSSEKPRSDAGLVLLEDAVTDLATGVRELAQAIELLEATLYDDVVPRLLVLEGKKVEQR